MIQQEYWYFAFGSNMSSEVFMQHRGMRPLFSEAAKLDGFELLFDQKGFPLIEPAFASIRPNPQAEVWGVLYCLSEADFNRLHLSEGSNYHVTEVEVHCRSLDRKTCYAYVGNTSVPGLLPSRRYAGKLIEGAKERQLPIAYIEMLESIDTIYVPLLSEMTGWIIRAVLKQTSKGKRISWVGRRLGAKLPEQGE